MSAVPNTVGLTLTERVTRSGHYLAVATLDSPKTLNALTLEVVTALLAAFKRWQRDERIVAVVLQSASPKAFCAGADVRSLRTAILDTPDGQVCAHAADFFATEYRLDHLIHCYTKPILVLGHGLVIGGGLGLMVGASHRVVTETTTLSMPEVSIGLFPDVAASWFLNRMPGRTGLFVGLTGARLNAADALFAGLADHAIGSEKLLEVIDGLAEIDWGNTDPAKHHAAVTDMLLAMGPPELVESHLRKHFDLIMQLTERSDASQICGDICRWRDSTPWLHHAQSTLAAGAPMTKALVWEQLRRAKHLSLADVFRLEYTMAVISCQQPDFCEGVRALLVDKDGQPQWRQLEALGEAQWQAVLEQHFELPESVAVHPLADL